MTANHDISPLALVQAAPDLRSDGTPVGLSLDSLEAAIAKACAEIDRLRAVNAELVAALTALRDEVVASGNWGASDFGWPKATDMTDVALARATATITQEQP